MNSNAVCHELQLTSHIAAICASNNALRLYGLIDGTTDNTALEQFFLLAPEAEYEPLFLGTEFEPCLPHSPYLLALEDCANPFMHQWGAWAEHRVIWFLSALSLQQQSDHWRSLIEVITPANDIAVFRFWSADILPPYLANCNSESRDLLIAPCHTLFTPHEKRSWAIWHNTSPSSHPVHEASPWWRVQPQHLQGFETAFQRVLADEIEDTLWRTEATALTNLYPALLPGLILQSIRQAQTLGLSSDNALTTFTRCQIRFGFNYWKTDALTPLWLPHANSEQVFLDWAQHQLA